jgi:hypothetical protein
MSFFEFERLQIKNNLIRFKFQKIELRNYLYFQS